MTPKDSTNTSTLPNIDISILNERLEQMSASEILAWAWETFGPHGIASSSFQTQSVPLLHLISQVCPEMPVIFIDTGFHFLETLAFRDELQARYGLNIVVMHPTIGKGELLAKYGGGLYRQDPDLCCHINKVEPMQRALSGARAWISGVRRDQTAHRKNLRVIEPQSSGLLKIHPMINWTKGQLGEYTNRYMLPFHPLFIVGYLSIGCAPCTRPVSVGQDERSGRWAGTEKNECGLHTDWANKTEEQNDPSE
ncbi:MAG: phosphoadenylyl-sulfate reductase [Chloroflexi bacterium]|nr:phosphoadenylyl-sulfate reductase [Chloroflexota bacterium]